MTEPLFNPTDPLFRAIAYTIRTAREKENLTQQELGELVGYSGCFAQVSVARWEACTRPIPRTMYRPLCNALKLPLECIVP